MNNIDLTLLTTDPIPIMDNADIENPRLICKIHPFTIRDIKDIGGELVFNSYLSALTINQDRLLQGEEDNTKNNQETDIPDFHLAHYICNADEDFRNTYLKAMSFVLKESVGICDLGFYIGETHEYRIINHENYDEFVHIVKLQNCIEKVDNKSNQDNPANDKAKELLEKRKKLREKLNKIKNKDSDGEGEPLTLADLVSILCANGNNINIFNVWDLSFYAFNDQFNRMKMLDDYQVNVRSILAGADPKEIELKHWMSKID